MKKRTIKKTYLYTDDNCIYFIFGLDCDNHKYIITNDNIEYLKNYVEEYMKEHPESEVMDIYNLIEKELEKVDEIQVIKD